MKRWTCRECGKKDVTIMIIPSGKLVIKCESCNDSRWVKR